MLYTFYADFLIRYLLLYTVGELIMNMMKYGFENYIFPTKTVDSDSEKWAQIKYNVYRFIDFSELKSCILVDFSKLKSLKTIELLYFSPLKSRTSVDFSLLKPNKHIELIDFSGLKSSKPIKLPDFSVLKSRASVDFSTASLYQTKV